MKVERALTLTVNNNYDFELKKLIPKADPSHPSRKPTTTMFAFSETTWEPRTIIYLENSISNLKKKDWEKIMESAAEYSNIINAQRSVSSKGKQQTQVTAEEEEELAWDSDSDSD